MTTLTRGQHDDALLAFAALVEERGPTIREFQDALELSSTSVASYRMAALEDCGLIEQYAPERAHGWRLTRAGRLRLEELNTRVPAPSRDIDGGGCL